MLEAPGACASASWMAVELPLILPQQVELFFWRRTFFLFILGVGRFTVKDEDGGARWSWHGRKTERAGCAKPRIGLAGPGASLV